MAAAQKKENHFIHLIMIIPSVIRLIANLTSLIELETRLSGKNLIVALILCLLCGSLLTATWLCMLAMLFLYLISLPLGSFTSLSILLIANILFLIIVGYVLLRVKDNIFFPRTRQFFHDLLS